MICRTYECPEGYEAGTSIAAERFPLSGAVAVYSKWRSFMFCPAIEGGNYLSMEMCIMHRRGAI
jgi:hypothetical protein